MKSNALVCLLLLLSAAPAWGQYDQQPLFMQYVDQDGKPVAYHLAYRRRLVYPLWMERFPFIDFMVASDTVRVRGFMLDTLSFVLDGPSRYYTPDGQLIQLQRYSAGKKSGRRVDFYPSGDTSRITVFSNDTAVSSICLEADHAVIHTGFDCRAKEPTPLNLNDIKMKIGYPPLAKEAGLQGKVILSFLVNKEGTVVQHVLVKQPHQLFTEAILKHAYQLRFEPGQLHGKPLATWVTVPFDFKIIGGR